MPHYFYRVSTQQLTNEVMALPLSERVPLAQALWQSIEAGMADSDQRDALREAARRDRELSRGAVEGRSHEAAKRAVRCA